MRTIQRCQVLSETNPRSQIPQNSGIRPLSSHLIDYPSKPEKTYGALQEQQERTWVTFSNELLHVDLRVLVDQLRHFYIIFLRTEDLPGAMDDKDGLQEKVKESVLSLWLVDGDTTYIYIYIYIYIERERERNGRFWWIWYDKNKWKNEEIKHLQRLQ